jgi:hypothetical protein
MSEEMRQELNGVKAEVAGLGSRMDRFQASMDGLRSDVDGMKSHLGVADRRLDRLEATTRKIAVVVAGHAEQFDRINEKLDKISVLDIKKSLDACMAEVIASRNERALMGRSFSDQQETLVDHELRLTRLERDRKPS